MSKAENIMRDAMQSANDELTNVRIAAAEAFAKTINAHIKNKQDAGCDEAAILRDTAAELGAALAINIQGGSVKTGAEPVLSIILASAFGKGFLTMLNTRSEG